MRCSVEFLERTGFSYNWVTLWVGRKLGIIETSEVTRYAEKYIVNNPEENNPLIIELAWNAEPQIVDDNLQKLIIKVYGQCLNQDSAMWITETRKWRYCILEKLRTDIKNHEELLEKISEIYSDMGYPNEMESFIYYMPPNDGYDPAKYSKEQNYKRLVQLLDVFLKVERDDLRETR